MKKIICFTLVISILIGLSGCHGSKDLKEFVVPESFDESKNYEITFWAKNDTNLFQVEAYQNCVDSFEKLYPNIKVNIKFYTDYNLIYNDVITNISTNTTPNVCISYPDHVATYLTGNNVVASIDDLVNNDKYGFGGSELRYDGPKYDELINEYYKEGYLNNSQYMLPFMRSSEALYINIDYVHKLGYELPDIVTWDFIWEVAKKATEKNEDGTYKLNNQKVMIPFIYKSTDNMTISCLKQLNAEYSNSDGEVLLYNDSLKKILNDVFDASKIDAFSTFKISSYPANYLNAGQCVFAIDSTAGATWMGCDAPNQDIALDSIVKFKTVVKPIPQYDLNNIKMISQGPSICIFNKADNNEVLASWLFAQYLLTNDIQIAYSQTEGYVPVTKKAINSKEYQEYLNNEGIDNNTHYDVKIEASKLILNNLDKTFVTAVFNGSASLRNAAGQFIEETVRQSKKEDSLTDEFLDNTLYPALVKLYKLDQLGSTSNSKQEFGPLPLESKALLITLASTWIVLATYFVIKKKHK